MEHSSVHVTQLSDVDLLAEVQRRAGSERGAMVLLIAALMELDARKLYLGAGCSSLFTYCTQILQLSEHAAYARIEAARAARRFPVILNLLADGAINLTTVGLLAAVLTDENHRDILTAAKHKSKRDVEALVVTLRPQPAVPSTIRKLPARVPAPVMPTVARDSVEPTMPLVVLAPASVPEKRRPELRPLAPDLYKIQFTVSRDTHDKLRRAQDLLRHQNLCSPS